MSKEAFLGQRDQTWNYGEKAIFRATGDLAVPRENELYKEKTFLSYRIIPLFIKIGAC